MSENPTQTQPAATAARPAMIDAGASYGAGTPAAIDREVTTAHGPHWVPLLPRKVFVVLVALGVVVGIAGPVLLWLNFQTAKSSVSERVGFLLVIIGLGLVMIAVPLVLGEVARVETASSIGAAGTRPESRDDSRGLTGSRIVAVLGIVLILAGAFLVRPVEPASTSDGGNNQGGNTNQGGNNNQGGGRNG